MKKNSFFKNIWNFLALWAGMLVSIFLGVEVKEMLKTFILNVSEAFEIATSVASVIITMLLAIVIALVMALANRKKQDE